jgi:hypothetical protein
MPRNSINLTEKVKVAIEELTKKGIKPSVRTLRKITGTGSNQTILKIMNDEYMNKNNIALVEDKLDASVSNAINKLVANKVASATVEINSLLSLEKEKNHDISNEYSELENENNLNIINLKHIEIKNAELLGELKTIRIQLENSLNELKSKNEQFNRLNIEYEKAKIRLEDLPSLRGEIVRLKDELRHIKTKRE